MPHYRVRIVKERRRDRGVVVSEFWIRRGRNHVGFDVQPVEREMDGRVHFARGLRLGGGEAFEMHDEDLRRAGDGDLFRRFALALAVRALPHLVFAEHLLLAVASEALVNVAAAGPGDLDADAVEGFVGGGGVLTCGAAETRSVLAGK